MRRPPVTLLALVGLAMFAIGSEWTSPGRTVTPSGRLFFFTGKELGIVNADGRHAKIVRVTNWATSRRGLWSISWGGMERTSSLA